MPTAEEAKSTLTRVGGVSPAWALDAAAQMHPELGDWSDEDYARAEEIDGVNWHLHLALDAWVIRRMSDEQLPDADVVAALEAKGMTRAEAVHRICGVLVQALEVRMAGSSYFDGPDEIDADDIESSEWRAAEVDDAIRRLPATPF